MNAFEHEPVTPQRPSFMAKVRRFFHIREITDEEKKIKKEEDSITDSEINMFALSGERPFEEWDERMSYAESEEIKKESQDHPTPTKPQQH